MYTYIRVVINIFMLRSTCMSFACFISHYCSFRFVSINIYEFWWYFRRGCSADPGLGRWPPTFVD